MLFFPLTILFFCAVALGVPLLLLHLYRRWKASASPTGSLTGFPSKEDLVFFAELADISYLKTHSGSQGRILVEGLELPLSKNNMTLQLMGTTDSNAIWLWKITQNDSQLPCTHIIVYRGSHAVSDWLYDISLVQAVCGGDPTSFRQFIESKYRSTCSLLDKHHVTQADIVCVGHSLGASVAEAIVAVNNARQGATRFTGVTFDSPGLPAVFRRSYNLDSSDLVTVNSVLNPVNSLTKPTAATFYSCGSGCSFTPKELLKFMLPYAYMPFHLISQTCNSHPMGAILQYLRDGDFRQESPENWPQISGRLVGLAFHCYSAIFPQIFGRTITIQLPANAPVIQPATSRRASAIPANSDLEQYPADGNLEMKRPYYVNDFKLLRPRPGDIILCMIGYTSAGKSSILKALLGLPANDDRIQVRATSNTTRFPIIVHWKNYTGNNRILLVDLPGFGAAKAEGGNLTWTPANVIDLIVQLRPYIGAAIFVVDSCYRDDMAGNFRTIQTELAEGSELLVVRNRKEICTEEDSLAVERQIADNLSIPLERVIPCRVARQPGTTGDEMIDPLLRALPLFVRDNCDQILAVSKEAWTQHYIKEKDSMGFIWTGAVGGATTALVTAPGLTGWGALAGPVLATLPALPVVGPVAVALVPLLVVTGTVVGFSLLKKAYWRKKAEEEVPM